MIVLRSALFNLVGVAWTLCFTVIFLPFLLCPPRTVRFVVGFWANVTARLLALTVGLEVEVRGRENIPEEPAIFASKHQSTWDTFVFHYITRKAVYVVKRELFLIPFYGWFVRAVGSIGIDREGGAAALKQMVRAVAAALAGGCSVVVFPEGTRTAPGQRTAYHPGIAALYSRLDAPMVPVALNSGLYWGRRSFVKRPGRMVVEFLPPIPRGLGRAEFMAELADRIEGASAALAADPLVEQSVDNPGGICGKPL